MSEVQRRSVTAVPAPIVTRKRAPPPAALRIGEEKEDVCFLLRTERGGGRLQSKMEGAAACVSGSVFANTVTLAHVFDEGVQSSDRRVSGLAMRDGVVPGV